MTDSSTGGFLQPTSGLPIADNALDTALQILVVGIIGLPGALVRPRWQPVAVAMPLITTDWCAIGVLDDDPEPNISMSHDGTGNGSSTSYSNDVISVMASFYGPTAEGNAKLLRDGLMIGQNRETLGAVGLALVEIPGKFMFAPETINEQTLRRADITMRFRRRTVLNWAILNVLTLNGTLLADNGNSDALLTPHSTDPLEP